LKQVKRLVLEGKVRINDNARRDARRCFGWRLRDIYRAVSSLKPRDFFKSEESQHKGCMLDFYKARNLCGEDVYTHLYIMQDQETELLIINSFKSLEGES
jgi:hypothetical protein